MDKRVKILVVDDDKNIRDSLAAILRDEGYVVDLAASGNEAIQKADETFYNVTLIDIRLPDMEGVELLTLMRDTVPHVRKIMVTGFPSMQNAIAALNKKADAYLVKPVEVEKLLETVREQLKLQDDERKFNQQKVAEFIETRVRELNDPLKQ